MSLMKSNGFLTAAVLLAVGWNANLLAQQYAAPAAEGIARVTDGRSRQPIRTNGAPRIQQVSSMQAYGSPPAANMPMSAPTSAYCPDGTCQFGNGAGGGICPSCQGRGCNNCQGRLFGQYTCKHSPDYGYSPPAKYPLQRRGVEYTRYYPARWYGAGGDYIPSTAPMVYQPTDTTQLGFYYQHVPSWQPQPNMMPARPIPAQWNITAPAVEASAFCRNGHCPQGYANGWDAYGYQNVGGHRSLLGFLHRGGMHDQGSYQSEWCPADATPTPIQQTPQPVPAIDGAAPAGNPPSQVAPQYSNPPVPAVENPPRPISNDPSAMIPLSPSPTTQVSAQATQIEASMGLPESPVIQRVNPVQRLEIPVEQAPAFPMEQVPALSVEPEPLARKSFDLPAASVDTALPPLMTTSQQFTTTESWPDPFAVPSQTVVPASAVEAATSDNTLPALNTTPVQPQQSPSSPARRKRISVGLITKSKR